MAFQVEGSKKKNGTSMTISYLDYAKKDQDPSLFRQASFEILSKYQNQLRRLYRVKGNELTMNEALSFSINPVLSPGCIWKLARMRLVEGCSLDSKIIFKYESGISEENSKDLELATKILMAAQKFSVQEFDRAEKLLIECALLASGCDSPIRRVVYFFADALRERIDREKGRIDLERKLVDSEESRVMFLSARPCCEQKLALGQICQFTGMQAILDSLASARKIHLVDFSIGNGSHWVILMQGLAGRSDCAVELLKITAVGTSENMLKETGKRLLSFAESLNLPFSFTTVISDTNDLKECFFQVEADETMAIYLYLNLCEMLVWPNKLESFIGFVKKLNPCLIVVIENEANTNTPIFIDRFYEAIVLASAVSDVLNTCLDGMNQMIVEEAYFREMILSTIIGDGEGGIRRFAKVDYWREFFAGFGLVHTELSESSLYQASLMLKTSASWSSVTLEMSGKSLILGWNGTPILSLSVWKFDHGSESMTTN